MNQAEALRRLTRLEALVPKPGPLVSRFHHPWLETLTDADLDVMDEAREHLEAGGDAATLSPAVRDRYAVLNAELAAWTDAHIG